MPIKCAVLAVQSSPGYIVALERVQNCRTLDVVTTGDVDSQHVEDRGWRDSIVGSPIPVRCTQAFSSDSVLVADTFRVSFCNICGVLNQLLFKKKNVRAVPRQKERLLDDSQHGNLTRQLDKTRKPNTYTVRKVAKPLRTLSEPCVVPLNIWHTVNTGREELAYTPSAATQAEIDIPAV